MLSGQTLTLVGNFQMPNSVDTCIAISHEDTLYDEYCYTTHSQLPPKTPESPHEYRDYEISIEHIDYNPP